MKNTTIILTLICLSILLTLLLFSPAIKINNFNELKSLIQNQKVQLSGKIIEQKDYDKITILKLDNNITLTYSDNYINLLNKNIEVTGTYDDFIYPKIKVLKIKII